MSLSGKTGYSTDFIDKIPEPIPVGETWYHHQVSPAGEETRWKNSSDKRILGAGGSFNTSTSASDTSEVEPGETNLKLIEEHEFLVIHVLEDVATIEFLLKDGQKKFEARLDGLASIGVVTPVINDKYKLKIYKSALGYTSYAVKVASGEELTFPTPAPVFDPGYIEFFKKTGNPPANNE
ncbi:MAG: hypothetical protein PHS14_05940 [Elusimicrobia bacterium]|nr:hypothetical protein [Elusimicrobiota bacterium]